MTKATEIKKEINEIVTRLIVRTMKTKNISLETAKERVFNYLKNEEPELLNVMIS